jgi:hypothetical protein
VVGPNDFLQDVVDLYRPNEGFRVLVVPSDTFMNGGSEFRNAGKAAAAHPLVRGVTEDPFHPVQPEGKIGVQGAWNREPVSRNFMILKRFETLLQSRVG